MTAPRLYADLAEWWPLLSNPADYAPEAADLLDRLRAALRATPATLLELGAGGGNLASHLKQHMQLTLTELSPAMIDVSRAINPGCEHIQGDMRTLRLGRIFDAVLIHDAIMYMTTAQDLRAALRTAAGHCRQGGVVAILPDCLRETFAPTTDRGGHDAPDGRGLRYLQWTWDPDPADETYLVDFAFLLRGADGAVRAVHDRHVHGLFGRDEWSEWLSGVGIDARIVRDPWEREIFVGLKR